MPRADLQIANRHAGGAPLTLDLRLAAAHVAQHGATLGPDGEPAAGAGATFGIAGEALVRHGQNRHQRVVQRCQRVAVAGDDRFVGDRGCGVDIEPIRDDIAHRRRRVVAIGMGRAPARQRSYELTTATIAGRATGEQSRLSGAPPSSSVRERPPSVGRAAPSRQSGWQVWHGWTLPRRRHALKGGSRRRDFQRWRMHGTAARPGGGRARKWRLRHKHTISAHRESSRAAIHFLNHASFTRDARIFSGPDRTISFRINKFLPQAVDNLIHTLIGCIAFKLYPAGRV